MQYQIKSLGRHRCKVYSNSNNGVIIAICLSQRPPATHINSIQTSSRLTDAWFLTIFLPPESSPHKCQCFGLSRCLPPIYTRCSSLTRRSEEHTSELQ